MDAKTEAIADACAHLNNVGLPNVTDILSALAAVTKCAALDPYLERDARVIRAQQILREYAQAQE